MSDASGDELSSGSPMGPRETSIGNTGPRSQSHREQTNGSLGIRDQRANWRDHQKAEGVSHSLGATVSLSSAQQQQQQQPIIVGQQHQLGAGSSTSSSASPWTKSGSLTFQIALVIVSVLMGAVVLAFLLACVVIYHIKPNGGQLLGPTAATATTTTLSPAGAGLITSLKRMPMVNGLLAHDNEQMMMATTPVGPSSLDVAMPLSSKAEATNHHWLRAANDANPQQQQRSSQTMPPTRTPTFTLLGASNANGDPFNLVQAQSSRASPMSSPQYQQQLQGLPQLQLQQRVPLSYAQVYDTSTGQTPVRHQLLIDRGEPHQTAASGGQVAVPGLQVVHPLDPSLVPAINFGQLALPNLGGQSGWDHASMPEVAQRQQMPIMGDLKFAGMADADPGLAEQQHS